MIRLRNVSKPELQAAVVKTSTLVDFSSSEVSW